MSAHSHATWSRPATHRAAAAVAARSRRRLQVRASAPLIQDSSTAPTNNHAPSGLWRHFVRFCSIMGVPCVNYVTRRGVFACRQGDRAAGCPTRSPTRPPRWSPRLGGASALEVTRRTATSASTFTLTVLAPYTHVRASSQPWSPGHVRLRPRPARRRRSGHRSLQGHRLHKGDDSVSRFGGIGASLARLRRCCC